eukprot:TRINITY_DN3022_c0_g2_i4.p1 TRINITY_DN3022_c0_g2~~TRINITY_DN3022_c0_g2_i4.p1  ORF type:complete len:139 (-),score=6.60 TRINITY_DN3022_c0_g2_i4:398-814(-)
MVCMSSCSNPLQTRKLEYEAVVSTQSTGESVMENITNTTPLVSPTFRSPDELRIMNPSLNQFAMLDVQGSNTFYPTANLVSMTVGSASHGITPTSITGYANDFESPGQMLNPFHSSQTVHIPYNAFSSIPITTMANFL